MLSNIFHRLGFSSWNNYQNHYSKSADFAQYNNNRKFVDISYKAASEDEKRNVEIKLRKILFVIPSINGGKLLSAMLPTLSIPATQIIVLDQASTDTTYQVCETHGVEIVQLGKAHSYTQCCNIALDLAKDRNAEFVFIANNDIVFITDVSRELVYEMMSDSNLGAVSCSQVIPLPDDDLGVMSYRVFWDLSITDFEHDRTAPAGDVYRLESDFCEGTCVLIRTQAGTEVGGFDDSFSFYHEDADFGLRLREAGYTTAYLPQSQIKHFAGSTFSQGKAEARLNYIKNSRKLFTEKHLGYGLSYVDHKNNIATSWNVVNQNLFPYMKRFGLIDKDRPELLFAHPGIKPFDCLYSVWETSKLPKGWLENKNDYLSVYLPSKWNMDVFQNAGFSRTHYVPLGVETDIFQPWGNSERQYDSPTFLWFARAQYRKGYDVMLKAWQAFSLAHPTAMLIVCGHGILPREDERRIRARQWRKFLRYDDLEAKISYRETTTPMTNEELAAFYRSVDFLVLTSRSEGFGFSVVEAMACGLICIFSSYGATKDMMYDGAITFDAPEVKADYADKDFVDVGDWWEPNAKHVAKAMDQAITLTYLEKKAHVRKALNLVRAKFTWRNTCLSIRADLKKWQTKKEIKYVFERNVSAPAETIADFVIRVNAANAHKDIYHNLEQTSIDIPKSFREFDRNHYLETYDDIKKLNIDPLSHYIFYGCLSGRSPSKYFDTKSYLAFDVNVRNIIGGLHNLGFGYSKGVILNAISQWHVNIFNAIIDGNTVEDVELIDLVYKIALNRIPDPSGRNHYIDFLKRKPTRKKELVKQMFGSSERAKIFPFEPTYHIPLVEEKPNSLSPASKKWFRSITGNR